MLLTGDCREILPTLDAESVDCVVTSPPYYGLRDYGVEGQIGMEETPAAYVSRLVDVFREVRRVLKDDGTCWINLGDSYAATGARTNNNGEGASTMGWPGQRHETLNKAAGMKLPSLRVGTNFLHSIQSSIKGRPLFIGDARTIRITSKRGDIPINDDGSPDGELLRLLGIKRVLIKQRDNDLYQVFHTLACPSYCWLCVPALSKSVNGSDLEIVLDSGYDPRIIVSDLNPDRKAIFGVTIVAGTGAGEDHDRPLSIEEAAKPAPKAIGDVEPVRDAVAFKTGAKCFPDVYLIDEAVPLRDALRRAVDDPGHFRVSKATSKEIDLVLGDSGWNLRIDAVAHLFALDINGCLTPYNYLLDKAERYHNVNRPKQELGIPDMVKRGLMEDGWICRQTIIWSKPNPMPESVTDRCTKSHEYIFLLSKSPKYYFDAESISESCSESSLKRYAQNIENQKGSDRQPGKTNGPMKAVLPRYGGKKYTKDPDVFYRTKSGRAYDPRARRNKRDVWVIPTQPFSGAHFATYPEELVRNCILAGCPPGGTVLDPFSGSGTTGKVALDLGRQYIGIELNPDYVKLSQKRVGNHMQKSLSEVDNACQ